MTGEIEHRKVFLPRILFQFEEPAIQRRFRYGLVTQEYRWHPPGLSEHVRMTEKVDHVPGVIERAIERREQHRLIVRNADARQVDPVEIFRGKIEIDWGHIAHIGRDTQPYRLHFPTRSYLDDSPVPMGKMDKIRVCFSVKDQRQFIGTILGRIVPDQRV